MSLLTDSMLEHSLRLVLHEERVERDVAAIAAAWQRGTRGSGAPENAQVPPRRRGLRRPPMRRTRRRALAAAVLAAAALALALLWKHPSAPLGVPLASARPDVWIVRIGAQRVERAGELVPGDLALASSPGGSRLELRSGGHAELAASTLVRLEAGHLELHAGSLRFERGPGAEVALHALGVTVRPAPDAAVELALEPTAPTPPTPDARPGEPPMNLEQIRACAAGAGVLPTALTVLVLAGSAELASAQGTERVTQGAKLRIDREGASSRPDAKWRAQMRDAFARIQKSIASIDQNDMHALKAFDQEMQVGVRLFEMLVTHPEGIDELRPELHRILAAEKTPEDVFDRMLDLLALDPSKEGMALAARLGKRWPDRFDGDQRLAFAERGVEEMAKALRDQNAAATLEQKRDDLEVTAWRALAGDRSGREALLETLRDVEAKEWVEVPFLRRAFLAGKALEALGEKDALRGYQAKLRAEVLDRLAKGDVDEPAWLVANAEYFVTHELAGKSGSVAFLDRRIDAWKEQRMPQLASKERVREALDRAAPER